MLSALLLTYLAGALADCYLRARLLLTRQLLCSAAHALPVPTQPSGRPCLHHLARRPHTRLR